MKKSRTIASLVLNILALIPLAFVFLNIVLAHLDLQWIGGFWPGFEALGQRRYLLYLLIYVANGFLGLALIGRIILDICQLAKPTIKGKFWAFFKDASTVAVVTGVVFTFVMDLCYDSPLANLVWTDPLNNVTMIMAIAPVLALVSGLFTEFDHKPPFLLTVLLPFPVYLWVIANAVFGAIGWGGNLGFHGYEIFNPAVTPVWETALLSVAIAAAGYLIGVLYWLVQAGLRKAVGRSMGLKGTRQKIPWHIYAELPVRKAVFHRQTPSRRRNSPSIQIFCTKFSICALYFFFNR